MIAHSFQEKQTFNRVKSRSLPRSMENIRRSSFVSVCQLSPTVESPIDVTSCKFKTTGRRRPRARHACLFEHSNWPPDRPSAGGFASGNSPIHNSPVRGPGESTGFSRLPAWPERKCVHRDRVGGKLHRICRPREKRQAPVKMSLNDILGESGASGVRIRCRFILSMLLVKTSTTTEGYAAFPAFVEPLFVRTSVLFSIRFLLFDPPHVVQTAANLQKMFYRISNFSELFGVRAIILVTQIHGFWRYSMSHAALLEHNTVG